MDLTLVVLFLLALFLWIVARIQTHTTPPECSPLPPPLVIDSLGTAEKTPLGVDTGLLRALYSVVEPPSCVSNPQRPHNASAAHPEDVRHILTYVARVASERSEYRFLSGNVIHSTVMLDHTGEGEFYITSMMHEASTSSTLRFSVRARMAVGSRDDPTVIHMNFDPQTNDRLANEPCRTGTVPVPEYGRRATK